MGACSHLSGCRFKQGFSNGKKTWKNGEMHECFSWKRFGDSGRLDGREISLLRRLAVGFLGLIYLAAWTKEKRAYKVKEGLAQWNLELEL